MVRLITQLNLSHRIPGTKRNSLIILNNLYININNVCVKVLNYLSSHSSVVSLRLRKAETF
jgi:hypothetical protein